MIASGTNLEYVAFAYAGVALAVALLVAFVLLEARRVNARLRALERQGISRGGPAA
jgi:Heme exporter protein D (CcmD)